jgi:hypothetical protein
VGGKDKFRNLDLWKIVTASYYFRYQDRHGCEKSLRFRCDRGVKQFSQRLASVRNVCPDRRKEPKPVFSSINGIAMVPVLISRLDRC